MSWISTFHGTWTPFANTSPGYGQGDRESGRFCNSRTYPFRSEELGYHLRPRSSSRLGYHLLCRYISGPSCPSLQHLHSPSSHHQPIPLTHLIYFTNFPSIYTARQVTHLSTFQLPTPIPLIKMKFSILALIAATSAVIASPAPRTSLSFLLSSPLSQMRPLTLC